ncbi:hypothetical protein SFMTTN_2034 [Sulfuriferula multivorans]|uniref:Phage protein n=1 Tax=Sulfuriferula multivorans TaxID=1559896 RepID=A0A401JF16_9PROT|nr:hypothetical protein SFMTTN_2034 [Sulfuriferula multivorans]
MAFGATDTLTLIGRFKQILTATGVISDTAIVTPLATTSGNSLASGAYVASAWIDTSNLGGGGVGTTQGMQFDGTLQANISTATPAGNINVYMQWSQDNGTTIPANGQGQLLMSPMVCTAVGVQPITEIAAR